MDNRSPLQVVNGGGAGDDLILAEGLEESLDEVRGLSDVISRKALHRHRTWHLGSAASVAVEAHRPCRRE